MNLGLCNIYSETSDWLTTDKPFRNMINMIAFSLSEDVGDKKTSSVSLNWLVNPSNRLLGIVQFYKLLPNVQTGETGM